MHTHGTKAADLRLLYVEIESIFNEMRDEDLTAEDRARRKVLRKELAAERCAIRALCVTLDDLEDRSSTLADQERRLAQERARVGERLERLFQVAPGWRERVRARINGTGEPG